MSKIGAKLETDSQDSSKKPIKSTKKSRVETTRLNINFGTMNYSTCQMTSFLTFLAHLSIACTVPYDIKWVYHTKKKVDAMSKAEKKQDARHSVWEIQSRIYDDEGNEIFTEQMINDYLASHDNVKWYAWIVHDKDVYTEEDKLKATDNADRVKVGELKPRHIHLVLQFSSRMRQSTLAKAFNLDARYVRLPEVYNKKLQIPAIVTYMTHEKQPDKQHYDPELIQTSTPDIIRPMVDDFKENHSKGHVAKKSRKVLARKLVEQISRGEITLPEIKEEWGLNFYFDFESHFLKARQEYMKMKYVMKPRINFYIEGESGVGKSTVARMLAKTLGREIFAKQMMEERTTTHQYKDDELYLEVGEKKVRFDAYEYQPILIWNDVRYDDLLKEFNREGVLNLLELSPTKRNYNIKYGGVILSNQVNIFNGIKDSASFIGGLVKEYKDSSGVIHEGEPVEQAFRRFPVILHVHSNYIEIKVRKEMSKNLSRSSSDSDTADNIDCDNVDDNIVENAISGENKSTDIVDNINDESKSEIDSTVIDEYYQLDKIVPVSIREVNRTYSAKGWDKMARNIMMPMVEIYEKYMKQFEQDDKIINPDYVPEVPVLEGNDAIDFIKNIQEGTDTNSFMEHIKEEAALIEMENLDYEMYKAIGESYCDYEIINGIENDYYDDEGNFIAERKPFTPEQLQEKEEIGNHLEIYSQFRGLYDKFKSDITKATFNNVVGFLKQHYEFLIQFPVTEDFIKIAENQGYISSRGTFIRELKKIMN